MAKNGKYTKHTKHIYRRIHLVGNGAECNLHKIFWCEGGIQMSDIGTKSVRGDELDPILGYAIEILDN